MAEENQEKPKEKIRDEEKKEVKEEKKEEKPKQSKPEKQKEPKIRKKISFWHWYDKNHKLLFFIFLAILVACIVYLVIFSIQTGDIMNKDITLTGGTLLTVFTSDSFDLEQLETEFASELGSSVIIRRIQEPYSNKQVAITIETKEEIEIIQEAAEEIMNIELNEENSSIEMTGTALSESFYNELITAIALAFLFMSIVVFIIFRKIVPTIAVIQAAVFDIAFALVLSNLFGIRMSTAGIAALLMLIGYSVDTDIMLTTKVLKRREKTINARIKGAFKTGIIMTVTSLVAMMVAYSFVQAGLLKQMFLIISFGLVGDLISTWLGNASILKWHAEKVR